MKTITAEMLVSKAKENGKELTMEQAEKMISERASLSDDQLTTISGGNVFDDLADWYEGADCPKTAPMEKNRSYQTRQQLWRSLA